VSANVGFATLQIIPSARGFASALSRETEPHMAASGRRGGAEAGKGFAAGFLPSLKGIPAALGAAFAGAKVVGFLKDSVGAASDLNETTSKVQVVFGKASGEVLKFGSLGAKTLGQSKLSALDAASSFGVFGNAAGLAGKANAEFSTRLVGLARDMASFSNTSSTEAIDALSAGLRGEAEPLQRFGVLLNDATLRQKALSLHLIKTTTEALTPQQRVLAANAVIWDQTTKAQGDHMRTSGALAGQQRILTGEVADLKAGLGAALLPAVTAVVHAFVEGLPILESTGAFLREHKAILLPLGAVLGGVGAGIAAVSLATKVWSIAQAALNLVLTANPIGGLVVALAGLTAGLVFAYQHSETFRDIVQGAFSAVSDAVTFLWDKVVRPYFHFIADLWLAVAGGIVHGAAAAFGWVPGLGGKLKDAAKAFDSFRDAVNASLDGIHDRKVSVEVIPTTKGAAFSGKVIPALASGGIIPRTPGGRLALIGEGNEDEAVIPLSRLGTWAPPAPPPVPAPRQPTQVPLQINLDGRVLATTVFEVGGRDYAAGRREF
jgi:hypothetical protein